MISSGNTVIFDVCQRLCTRTDIFLTRFYCFCYLFAISQLSHYIYFLMARSL